MPIRMRDIANDLGVSAMTVSKAFRNHPDISEETRKRVLRRAGELNYRPNLAARALATGRTFVVGLVAPDLGRPFFAGLAQGVSGVLRDRGYGLLISSSEEAADLEKEEISRLLARRVDALLLASVQSAAESFREIEQHKTPYVLIGRQVPGLSANFVGIDEEQAGALATAHLLENGRRRIAHIWSPEAGAAPGQLDGYRRALAEHFIDVRPELVGRGGSADSAGKAGGYRAMRRLLQLPQHPDGVFCCDDPTALGAMQAIGEAGLRIPGDIAVIGCGNVFSERLNARLSSIDQHGRDAGVRAAQLAVSLIEARTPPRPAAILLEPHVVVRASTDAQQAAGE
jgi:LacI family transcriptional regulator